MVTGSVPLTLALFVLQSAAGTLDASHLARIYARQAATGDAAAIDLENAPRLELGLAWPTTTLTLDYSPRLLWMDMLGADPSPALLLHSAGLRLSWRRPRYTLSFAQTAAVGDQNFARFDPAGSLAAPAPSPTPGGAAMTPPELDLLPRATLVRIAAAETSASLRYAWSQRWSSELRTAFDISGGANADAQRFLPRRRTARVDASVGFRGSRRDDLSTGLSVAQTSTSNGYDHWLASLTERWSRSFAPESGGELGAGVAIQDTTGPAGTTSTKWVPVGTASAWHAVRMRAAQIRLRWDLGYRPEVNVLAGTLQSRLSTTAQASLLVERSSVRLTLGAAQTFPRAASDAAEVISADLALERELLEWLSAELGAQILRQRSARGDAPASIGSRWLLYGGLRARLPEARF